MTVTVVTVCLNAAETIAATIESVRAQRGALSEFVIVDGGSTDRTCEIIAAAESAFDGKLRWTSEPDAGIYDAMNKGLARVTGDYVVFLGADDLLLNGALDAIAAAGAASPDVDLICGDTEVVEADGRHRLQRGSEGRRFVSGVPWSLPAIHQACALSAAAYERLGGFDTSFRIAGDYEFYLRFHEAGLRLARIETPLVAFSLAGVSTTAGRATAEEYRRARVMHGVSPLRARVLMWRSLAYLSVGRVLRRSAAFDRLFDARG